MYYFCHSFPTLLDWRITDHHFLSNSDGSQPPTRWWQLTFDTLVDPPSVYWGMGDHSYEGLDFFNPTLCPYPSPLRHFNCNKFEPSNDRCNSQPSCVRCSRFSPAHDGICICGGPLCCFICVEPHAASSKDCIWERVARRSGIRSP